jgi:hypothetical protein
MFKVGIGVAGVGNLWLGELKSNNSRFFELALVSAGKIPYCVEIKHIQHL